ncbi:MAG TPA: FAD-dependent oxidoreductase [Patescibacteria group bacterium]|nr:FAD-dependent oxidoreductase [Patescibacteria group bacterium]
MNLQNNQEPQYDVIIVGGAAAGLTAALYTARRALKTLVIAKSLGGQAAMAPMIENYPGIQSVGGVDLMWQFLAHAQKYGAECVYETVSTIKKQNTLFTVSTSGTERTARAVILAFGLTQKSLGVPGEERLLGKGVTYCATCDAPLYKEKIAAVVGGTYEALDAALLLARMHCATILIHSGDGYPAQRTLFEQVKINKHIQLSLNSSVVSINGKQKVESITIQKQSGQETISINGVFIENGLKIDSAWLGDLVEYDKRQAVIINNENETKTPGLFAAGDVTPIRDKQVIISAGEGAKAALATYRYIQKLVGKPTIPVDWVHA